jgi:hypothetical protein
MRSRTICSELGHEPLICAPDGQVATEDPVVAHAANRRCHLDDRLWIEFMRYLDLIHRRWFTGFVGELMSPSAAALPLQHGRRIVR